MTNTSNSNTPITQATVLPYTPPNPNTIPISQINQLDHLSLRLGKTVKFIAIIDVIFTAIYAFSQPFYLLALPFPILGIRGAEKFHKYYILSFFSYLLIALVAKLSLFSFAIYTYSFSPFDLTINIISILIDIYFTKLTYKFYTIIKNYSNQDQARLRSLNFFVRYIFW